MSKRIFSAVFLINVLFCSFSAAQYRVLFSSDRSGNGDLYVMDANGGSIERLTSDTVPEWSPVVAGKGRITYLKETEAGIGRFELTPSNRKITPVPQPEMCILDDKNVQYGPVTGTWLYFCPHGIYISEPDGTDEELVTGDFQGTASLPSWSRNEAVIVFTGVVDGHKDIFSLDLSSGEIANLTQHPSNDDIGDLSPDGRYLVFTSDREGNNNQDLYIRDLEAGTDTNITNTPDWELIGRWSPDGRSIVFGSNRAGNWELYRYDLERAKTVRLTFNEAFDGDPRFLVD